MTEELKTYLIRYCRDWMLPEEINALRRIDLTEHGEGSIRSIALNEIRMENMYGFKNEFTNDLIALGKVQMELVIAKRILRDSKEEVLNYCASCLRLARTPEAKQCKHCLYDWH